MEEKEISLENEVKEENTEVSKDQEKKPKKKGKALLIICILLVLIIALVLVYFLVIRNNDSDNNNSNSNNENTNEVSNQAVSAYKITSNGLNDFDLYFLQLENKEENKVYSPLSIKYALQMLSLGTDGDTKKQIDAILGEYSTKKYVNSKNMSFANSLFIRDTFKSSVKSDYTKTLKEKYSAEVIYDSFKNVKTINKWVSDKTFKLIPDLLDDVSDYDFVLINALAIDMEWNKKIQAEYADYTVEYDHENYSMWVADLSSGDYTKIEFNGHKNRKAVEIGAVANKYDIISDKGEDNIKKIVSDEYEKWLKDPESCGVDEAKSTDAMLKDYMKELNSNYKQISSSTDFLFDYTDEYKVFAKDLKTYNGTTLQYVGIMPTKEDLKTFVKNTNATKLNEIVEGIKPIELDSFKDGVITEIKGYIPLFNFEYELNLMDDLKSLGVSDVFDPSKADLSKLTDTKGEYIDSAKHKANIEFSNEGIKAAAATTMGGKGAAMCGFDYLFDVPVETIDLTFDNPFMFIIRDKDSGEVWFTGTVYDGYEYKSEY